MDINELTRLLLNLIRKGSIAVVDLDAKKCRVKTGDLVSNWVPWIALRSGTTRTWNPPTVGEQVLFFCPGGDPADGVALCGLYSDDAPAPSGEAGEDGTYYPDGAIVKYNHVTHALTATLPGGGTVVLTAPDSVTINTQGATINAETATINAAESLCTGNLTVQGKITGQGGMAISGGAGGGPSAVIEGDLHATGDLKAGDISVRDHHHDEQGDLAATSKAKA